MRFNINVHNFNRPYYFRLVLGGAIDHAILALRRSERTPYGARLGIIGNWAFAGFDLAIVVAGYILYSRAAPRS